MAFESSKLAYSAHGLVRTPEDQAAPIWRYLDFTKYVSLLDRQALFFTRADRLQDKFEGTWPLAALAAMERAYAAHGIKAKAADFFNSEWKLRQFAFLSCWNALAHESAALWSMYAGSGVAVRSSFERLTQSLPQSDNAAQLSLNESIFVGLVEYMDYDTDELPTDNILRPWFVKRRSFEFEHELRAVVRALPEVPTNEAEPFAEHGIYLPVDIGVLIDEVRVAPTAPEWYEDLVRSVSKKYGLGVNVCQSDLARDPVY